MYSGRRRRWREVFVYERPMSKRSTQTDMARYQAIVLACFALAAQGRKYKRETRHPKTKFCKVFLYFFKFRFTDSDQAFGDNAHGGHSESHSARSRNINLNGELSLGGKKIVGWGGGLSIAGSENNINSPGSDRGIRGALRNGLGTVTGVVDNVIHGAINGVHNIGRKLGVRSSDSGGDSEGYNKRERKCENNELVDEFLFKEI